MLKWAKQTQRRTSECSDASLETCSNISSDSSSESSITVPIRYHERRASRPKSLALSSTDVLDLDHDNIFMSRRAQRTTSSPLYSSCSRVNRHSMIVTSKESQEQYRPNVYTTDSILNNNNNILKISTVSKQEETNTSVLKITTNTQCEKQKSRNSFWRNLRARAQGKKSDKKLAKSHSTSNIPELSEQADAKTPTNDDTPEQISYDGVPLNKTIANTCPSPVMMRRQQTPLTSSLSPSKSKANVIRRRSFKLIKKQNESKKPKPFTKVNDSDYEGDNQSVTSSPDSGISSIRYSTDSDYESRASPLSPITPISIEANNPDLSCLKQQFTDVVLQFLNERLEKKGYATIIDRSSSTSSNQSDEGAPDIFCYDTDTVARRPSHHISQKTTVEATH